MKLNNIKSSKDLLQRIRKIQFGNGKDLVVTTEETVDDFSLGGNYPTPNLKKNDKKMKMVGENPGKKEVEVAT